MTAGAAPPPAILEAMAQLNIEVTHAYGLTEVYGPAVVCSWRDDWDELPLAEQAEIKSRQGVRYPMLEELLVVDPETMQAVPRDGETIGEIMFRGNIVMKGYLKNPSHRRSAGESAFLKYHRFPCASCPRRYPRECSLRPTLP